MANPLYGQNKADDLVDNVSGAVVNKTASYSVTAAMSGELHILSGGAVTATLPAVSAGLRYTFISGDDSEHVVNGMASKGYGFRHQHVSGTEGDIDAESVRSSLTLNAGAIGDRIEVLCDGVNWYFKTWSTGAITPA